MSEAVNASKLSLKFDLENKIRVLKNVRHEIRKKRFILDESREKFGFDDMTQLSKVKNTSEVKGYPFVASKLESKVLKGLKIGLKVVPIETKYEKHEHPTNLEFLALKELTDNIVCKMISPHIVFYLGNQKVSNKSKALKFLNLKRLEVEEKIRSNSNMLISEYIEGGSLDNWIYEIYENDSKISDKDWRIIVFQLIYTISIIQHYYRMMHNDFHYGNILMDTSIKKVDKQYFVYKIDGEKYYIPNNGVLPKLWDFEFAMTFSNKIPDFYPNKFIIGDCEYDRKNHITKEPVIKDNESLESDDLNVPYNYNDVYDLHYFLTSLLDLYISQELFDWILEIYPDEVIPRENSDSESDSESDSYSDSHSDNHSDNEENSNNSSNKLIDKLDRVTLSESDNTSDMLDEVSSHQTSSSSSSSSSLSSSSSSSSSSRVYNRYLSDGRLKNGIEKEFNLPTPLMILKNKLFDEFRNKPLDFDESNAIYFKAGF
jgi:serine/threonine protein kinase